MIHFVCPVRPWCSFFEVQTLTAEPFVVRRPSQNGGQTQAANEEMVTAELSAPRCLDGQRALRMIALACNFHIFAARITARLAAVLLAVRNIATAWNMRAFLALLVHHDYSSDRYSSGSLVL